MTPPNILWICTDQQRADTIGALGNPHIRTPHIDGLVDEGVTFTQAYCQSPVCTPSRASFLTGRYPRTTRCRQNGQQIPSGERLISRLLADAGYTCGLAGKLHLSSCANRRVERRIDDGYDEFHWSHHPQPDWPENAYTRWLAEQGQSWEDLHGGGPATPYVTRGVPARFHQTTWCAERGVEFIRRHAAGGQPWLFSLNCFDPHHPFDPPPENWARMDWSSMPLPVRREGELADKPVRQQLDAEWAHNEVGGFHAAAMTDDDRRQVTAAYYAMIELIDEQVGRLLRALEETGQAANTLVIFMSDHGEMLGDHGLYYKGPHFYDPAVRVPLVMRWDECFAAGRRVDDLVELVDLAPTLMAAAGGQATAAMQGRSLLPWCVTDSAPDRAVPRDHVFSEYYNSWTHPGAYATMLRTRRHKVVVHHATDRAAGEGELYDLQSDPHELTNLWLSPDHRELREELVRRAFDASVLTMDPCPPRLGPF